MIEARAENRDSTALFVRNGREEEREIRGNATFPADERKPAASFATGCLPTHSEEK